MERRIKEENVTKSILLWLESKGWEIISFDFPQSGTGILIHPNDRTSKNAGFIPDIVTIKDGVVLFFENKDRYVFSDFEKVDNLRHSSDFGNDIQRLLQKYSYSNILYGVAMPFSENNLQNTLNHIDMVDFALLMKDERTYECLGYKI